MSAQAIDAEPTREERRRAKSLRKRAAREAKITPCEPICAECGKLGQRVKGDAIYPHRPDLFVKSFFLCECGAYVGCHPFTRIALGTPAGPETRRARNAAHAAFDPLWKRKMAQTGCDQATARDAGYAWLAIQLGMEPGRCHVAWMNKATALRVVELCSRPQQTQGLPDAT